MRTIHSSQKNRGVSGIDITIVLGIIAILITLSFSSSRSMGYKTWINKESNYKQADTINQGYIPPPPYSPPTTNTTPVITLYGDNPYQIFHPGTIPTCDPPDSCPPPRTDIYKEPGYKAYDKEDGDITRNVVVEDEIMDTAVMNPCHQWNKKYTVRDSKNNTVAVRRSINECNGM